MVLGLLGLRPNRTPQAWWVWLPLLACLALENALRPALSFIPSEPLDMICQCVTALTLGTAALWLTLPLLNSKHRLVAFLKGLLVLGAAAGFVFATSQSWSELGPETFAGVVALGLLALALSAALALGGWNCRRRYHPGRLGLWLGLWLLVASTAILLPFAALAVVAGGAGALTGFTAAIVASVAINAVVLLPFLLLSFVNSLYRERLKQYLRLGMGVPPPVVPPPPVTTSVP